MIRALTLILALAFVVPANAQPWPTHGWTVDDDHPTAAFFQTLDTQIAAGEFGLVDRMVVVKDGYLIVDKRYPQDYEAASQGRSSALGCGFDSCPDEESAANPYNYLHPSTHPYFQGRDVHSLQSVTKSVASTLVGIAITRGDLSGVSAPLLPFFGEYDLSNTDSRLADATLDDLLTMRTGIEWHEQDRPFNETNTTLQLEASEDWIQFTLDQPSDAAPGEKWVYNSGGSHLMSGVIRSATNVFIDAYAEEHLFGPLGIDEYHWKKTPQGFPDTEGGLYLEALDLAKIGYLYLQNGRWENSQLLDSTYAAAATSLQVERVNRQGWGYGYQWWRLDRDVVEVWAGLGFGGQYLLVLPESATIGVVNSWNLFGRPQRAILPAFLGALIEAWR